MHLELLFSGKRQKARHHSHFKLAFESQTPPSRSSSLSSETTPSDNAKHYHYDTENRLAQVEQPHEQHTTKLDYDPLGRLFSVQQSQMHNTVSQVNSYTEFLYSGDQPVAEYNQQQQLQRRYVHGSGIDEPLVWFEGPTSNDLRYLIQDHQEL